MKILFIGNSHTYYNDMTQIFSSLANTNGHDVQVDSVTKGGWILHNYLDIPNEQTERIEEIASNEHFDYCFLQEQALVPVVEYDAFADGVKRLMDKLQKAVDSFILYETFGWGQGNYRHVEHGLDFNSHCSKTIEAYERLGDSLNLSVSPAGVHFRSVVLDRPDIPMFRDDLVHATYAGSCLIALTHYHTLFRSLPDDTSALDLPQEIITYFMDLIRSNNGK